jgi:hypothetical protein
LYENGPASSLLKNAKITVFANEKCLNVERHVVKDFNAQVCAGVLDGRFNTSASSFDSISLLV